MEIYASAPMCIFELGRWTDTKFAEHGAAFSVAAARYARVRVTACARGGLLLQNPRMDGPDLTAFFRAMARRFGLESLEGWISYDLTPLEGGDFTAAGAVALTGALASLAGAVTPRHRVAMIAHQVCCDLDMCARGIQPFLTAALGGTVLTEIAPYPRAFPRALSLAERTYGQLACRLLLVGARQQPVAVQPKWGIFCRAMSLRALWALRALPAQAAEALQAGDYPALGHVMQAQAQVQQAICPGMMTPTVRHIVGLAQEHGALVALPASSASAVILHEPAGCADLQRVLQAAGYAVQAPGIDRNGLRVRLAQTFFQRGELLL